MLLALLVMATAYFVGSIPIGLIVGKIGYNKDIRHYGSRNLGATNTFRVLGTFPGIIVLICDVFKGLFATGLASYLFSQTPTLIQHPQNVDMWHSAIVVITGMVVICGHNWSLFLKFSGGKGVATGAGVLIMLVPVIFLFLLIAWAIIIALTRYVSLASIIVTAAFPILMIFLFPHNIPYIVFAFGSASTVIFRHRSNLKRLVAGNENKIGKTAHQPRGNK